MTETPPAQHSGNEADRGTSPYTMREKIQRILWNYLGQTVFRMTFHNWYGVRASILRAYGARIGNNTRIRPTVRIEQPWNLIIGDNSSIGDRSIVYCLGPVTIGAHVSISQHAHLCAGSHDFNRPDMPLLRPPVAIGDHAWIAADAFVGPNVVVGEGAILGARGVAVRHLKPWTIYAGNPAREVRSRERPTMGNA